MRPVSERLIYVVAIATVYLCPWQHIAAGDGLPGDSRGDGGGEVEGAACPKGCACVVRQAYCDGLSLTRVPRDLTRDLEALHMRSNNIRKLRYGPFRGLTALKHVILKGNQISNIKPDTFKDLRNLISLSLTENRLRRIDPATLRPLTELRVFSLRGNKLSSVEKLFAKQQKLQLLNLGGNRLKRLTQRSFRFNWQLQILDLHDNKIRMIHKHAFRALPFLKFLVLRDNPLFTLELDFRLNFHLDLLDLTNCRLTDMVRGLPFSISDLRLSENNLTYIGQDAFTTTRKVRLLVLNNNQIESIHDRALSTLWHLYDIYLGGNKLQQLPGNMPASVHAIYANYNNISSLTSRTFWRCQDLYMLYLRHNKISYMEDDVFTSMTRLQSLDLSQNAILHIKPYLFRYNGNLEKLDISSNPINSLDYNCFEGLRSLHIFQMSSVGTQELSIIEPTVFKDMTNLMFLDLSNSSTVVRRLAQDPDILGNIKSVQDLNLMQDGLLSLPEDFSEYFPNLRLIKLVGNPWHCDKNILPLAYWMRNRTNQFFAPLHMRCASPPELYGRLIYDLTGFDVPDATPPPTEQGPNLDLVHISFKHISEAPAPDGKGRDVIEFTRVPSIDWRTKHANNTSNRYKSDTGSDDDMDFRISRPPDYAIRSTDDYVSMAQKPATIEIRAGSQFVEQRHVADYTGSTKPAPGSYDTRGAPESENTKARSNKSVRKDRWLGENSSYGKAAAAPRQQDKQNSRGLDSRKTSPNYRLQQQQQNNRSLPWGTSQPRHLRQTPAHGRAPRRHQSSSEPHLRNSAYTSGDYSGDH